MKKFYFLLCLCFCAMSASLSAQVVINEVYGGGGNSGAPYKNDFIELFNNGAGTVNLSGWSVQYASAAGTSWSTIALTGSILPGHYYLVQAASGGTPGINLPTPDDNSTTLNMSATTGKVALCSTTTPLIGATPSGAQIVDLVGYGTAGFFEGTGVAPAASNTTSIQRSPIGHDSNNNNADFVAGSPTPLNSSSFVSSAIITSTPGSLAGFSTTAGTASASQFVTVSGSGLTDNILVNIGAPYETSVDGGTTYSTSQKTLTQSGGSVTPTIINIRITAAAPAGTANSSLNLVSTDAPTQSVSLTGTVNSSVVVNPLQAFNAAAASFSQINLTGTGNAAGNNIVVAFNTSNSFGTPSGSPTAGTAVSGGGTVLYNGSPGSFSFAHTGLNAATAYFYQAWSIDGSDNYSSPVAATATTNTPPAFNVVINQVYGGGGNSGATYKNDFIELYNNENTPVNLSGWSLQYSSAAGTGSWQIQTLSGVVPAHSFFLVQEAAGSGGTVALPTPDVSGSLALSGTAGKVLLSNSVTAQSGANPVGATVIDKVGYGATATGFETSPAGGTDNTTGVMRITDGADNDNNSTDFAVTTPVPRNTLYKTTAPLVASLSPANGSANIPSNIPLALIFDKPVIKGTGTITIYVDGVAGTPLDVNDAGIVISNNTNIAIPSSLTGGKAYSIQVSAGAFTDIYGNAFAGILNNTSWAFTTYNSAVATTLPAIFDFQNCTGNGLLPGGFTQYSESGDQVWDCTTFGRNGASAHPDTASIANGVQINGYANNADHANLDWLISPKLDLTGTNFPLLSFYSRNAFAGDPLVLKVSTDYSGSGNPNLATWTDLNGKFPNKGSDVWALSKDINLSAYKQAGVYFAFVYTSTTDDGSRWTIDDISLVNSATPPAPSLTLGSSNLEFGYTATGGNTVKTITLTANDLAGDVTLTTTGDFQVSVDGGTTFASAATILQATANNIPQTIYVRFSPSINNIQYVESLNVSISDSSAQVSLKGNSIDPASTLNVVDWNLAWFATPDPTPGFGPTNKSLQQDNVAIVLKSIPADLFVLQEVVNEHALDSIVNTMPGYAYRINNYGSHSSPADPLNFPLTEIQKLAFVFKTTKFSNVQTIPLLTKGINTAADLSNPYYDAFASGRFPYMMSADVTLSDNSGGTITQPMRFINVHAKANTAPVLTAYDRRVSGAKGLDSLIKADHLGENVIVLGDLNDDLNQTITPGVTPPRSSYYPFTEDDASLYIFPTKPLGATGQHSDVNFVGSVIDNVIATRATARYYLPGSATVLSDVGNLVPKYGSTTSDHYPVFTQFSFSTAAALPVTLVSFTAVKQNEQVKLSWTTSQEVNSLLFDIERSADGSSFTKIGTVAAQGNSSVKVDYAFNDKQPFAGNNYYRLKQVDRDGKTAYSAVVKVNFGKQPAILITPNPASSFIYISLENINTTAKLQIIDLNGKLLKQLQIGQNTANTTISLAGLAKGLYMVKLVSAEKTTTQKLVIQ